MLKKQTKLTDTVYMYIYRVVYRYPTISVGNFIYYMQGSPSLKCSIRLYYPVSLWSRANARNVRMYNMHWQYTNFLYFDLNRYSAYAAYYVYVLFLLVGISPSTRSKYKRKNIDSTNIVLSGPNLTSSIIEIM